MRVVLDTNVLVSAFLWQGLPQKILQLAQKSVVTICVTREMLDEFEHVLSYPKFRERLTRVGKTPSEIIDEFVEVIESFPSHPFSKPHILADPTDDMFLACALSSKAFCIVSGDRHLLDLQEFHGIPILTSSQFLSKVKYRKRK